MAALLIVVIMAIGLEIWNFRIFTERLIEEHRNPIPFISGPCFRCPYLSMGGLSEVKHRLQYIIV